MSYACENDYYLENYYREQEESERKWHEHLPEKYEDIIHLAQQIMSGECSDDDFHLAFTKYYCEEEGEYFPYVLAILRDYAEGNDFTDEDEVVLHSLAKDALEAACEIEMDCELYYVALEGRWSIKNMVKEVLS